MPYSYKIKSTENKVEVSLGERKFRVDLKIRNLSDSDIKFKYGLEFNFSMMTDSSDKKYYIFNTKDKRKLSEEGAFGKVKDFGIIDKSLNFSVNIQIDKNCELWYFPVRTVTNSEAGFERTYQSSCLIPTFNISLKEKDSFTLNLTYSLTA